jgi:hypothetical protein
MGVVFSVLFALGVLLIEQGGGGTVDLDADCVLHGQLETLGGTARPTRWAGCSRGRRSARCPGRSWVLAVMVVARVRVRRAAVQGAADRGVRPGARDDAGLQRDGVLHYLLMVFVAAATVASFEAVGSILVIAMLVCPAATARDQAAIRLTADGLHAAAQIVRRHRQWETYLVGRAGVRADQVHPLAESFEHLRGEDAAPIAPTVEEASDPHGRPIPPEDA